MYCVNCLTGLAKKSGYCHDCHRHKVVNTKSGSCFAYSGSFDEEDNPVTKSGHKIMPGIRKCGNRDCINRDHIILAIEFERFDSSYTIGVRRSPEEIWSALLKEKSGFKGTKK